ncbi:barstar family protein [Streptomyces sp. NPDC048232]|uniref:barstar family protein n=1 Tax=Streptomyces sp. NPDC048232 TaxID=3365520 RepID=UPI003719B073
MMCPVLENSDLPGLGRYTLTDTEDGHVWGVCDEIDGLFGEPERGTYELFGWIPEGGEVRGWVGSRVWLVPDGGNEGFGPWLLEDVVSPVRPPGTDGLVLRGLDDCEGPPEGHRTSVRLHDGRRWLGSCREFARVLPPEREVRPLVLRGLAPGDRLRGALAKGTRRALDLEQAGLEMRDGRGGHLAERLLWARVMAWRPSSRGANLIDLELDSALFEPVPVHARPVWERWLAGPPVAANAWAGLDTRLRETWLELVRERGCRRPCSDRPAGHAYEIDGRHITDEPGLHLALGEAVNGPGGYFGGCLDALADCLRGTFGYTAPATLLWRDAGTARDHLSRVLTADGRPSDLFAEVLGVIEGGGMRVTLA